MRILKQVAINNYFLILFFGYFCSASPVIAQVVSDGTTNTVVNNTNNVFTIEGGITRGSNLFHSFKEFSLPTNTEAFFNNASNISNIFSRITGNNISDIDGAINSLGTANLFLINPNGIVFGENASLNIGGSFFATTAESVIFSDGVKFSVNTKETPLLTVNIPIGLQTGQNPGSIIVKGNGHNIDGDTNNPFVREDFNRGLETASGATLGLIGGDIAIEGGILSVPKGNLSLSAIAANEEVSLSKTATGWHIKHDRTENFSDISISNKALLDASNNSGGSINLTAKNIAIDETSFVWLQNEEKSGGNIVLNASDTIDIRGSDADIFISTNIRNETIGAGDGGAIRLKSKRLILDSGARIGANTFGLGKGGDVSLEIAESITIGGYLPLNPFISSYVYASTAAKGKGGNVTVATPQLNLFDGGTISTAVLGEGTGGDVTVNASNIEMTGITPRRFVPSAIGASNFGTGKAGNVTVNADRLSIANGARITSSTLSAGNGGSLKVNATESIFISGVFLDNPASIKSSVQKPNIFLQRVLQLPAIPTGNAGNITINTPQLTIDNGAKVTVENEGIGSSGNTLIKADAILLKNDSSITASNASDTGGNIILDVADNLVLQNSQMIAESKNFGNGGNLTIDSYTITLLDSSTIDANARQGDGGNIAIETKRLFQSADSSISATSQLGIDGVIKINNTYETNNIGLVQLNANLKDQSDYVTVGCRVDRDNSFAITGNGGLSSNPTQFLLGTAVWQDLRPITIDETQESVTSLSLLEPNETVPNNTIIEATQWRISDRGSIELVALPFPKTVDFHYADVCN